MRGDVHAARAWLARAPQFGVDAATGVSYGSVVKGMHARVLLDSGEAETAIEAMPAEYRAGDDDDYAMMPSVDTSAKRFAQPADRGKG